jgi:hypothetical protein
VINLKTAKALGLTVRQTLLARQGRLKPELAESHVAEPVPLSAVYPQGHHRMPKVRTLAKLTAPISG